MGASGSASLRGEVKLSDQFIQVAGDMAYELGVERGQFTLAGQQVTIDHRVTTSIVENLELGRLSITTLTFLRRCWMFSAV